MRKIFKRSASLLLLSFCMLFGSAQAAAPHGNTGLGIVLGDPTGITVKHWMDSRSAIDGGLAYALSDFVLIYGDYLYHFNIHPGGGGKDAEFKRFLSDLRPYIGVGGLLLASTRATRTQKALYVDTTGTSSSLGLGLRIPLGLEWIPSGPPIGVFLELAPGIGIIPGTFAMLNAGIGVRFYF